MGTASSSTSSPAPCEPEAVEDLSRDRDLAIFVGLAERHVSRQLRLAYLAPEVLKRLVYGREVLAVTVLDLSDCAALPWAEQAGEVFEAEGQRSM